MEQKIKDFIKKFPRNFIMLQFNKYGNCEYGTVINDVVDMIKKRWKIRSSI